MTKSEREYLVIVYNGRKVLASSMYLEKIKMTPANCRRLMIEALQLIKELHKIHIKLDYQITRFIQIEVFRSDIVFSIIRFKSNKEENLLDN